MQRFDFSNSIYRGTLGPVVHELVFGCYGTDKVTWKTAARDKGICATYTVNDTTMVVTGSEVNLTMTFTISYDGNSLEKTETSGSLGVPVSFTRL